MSEKKEDLKIQRDKIISEKVERRFIISTFEDGIKTTNEGLFYDWEVAGLLTCVLKTTTDFNASQTGMRLAQTQIELAELKSKKRSIRKTSGKIV